MSGGSLGLIRSEDRGETWSDAVFDTGTTSNTTDTAVEMPSGRIVAGGSNGMTYSDDGGVTFFPSQMWQFLRYGGLATGVVTAADGTPRVLAGAIESGLPHLNAHWSADGINWTSAGPLPDASPGVGYGGVSGPDILAIGGASAVIVLARGAVYRTDDAGLSWSLVGVAPVDTSFVGSARSSVLGPDGRLYVGIVQNGPGSEFGWVYRSVEPLVVASEEAPEPSRFGLAVRPNPSSVEVTVDLRSDEPSAVVVSVFDARGREVAVVFDGDVRDRAEIAVDTSGLAPGVYVVRASSGGRVVASATFSVVR